MKPMYNRYSAMSLGNEKIKLRKKKNKTCAPFGSFLHLKNRSAILHPKSKCGAHKKIFQFKRSFICCAQSSL